MQCIYYIRASRCQGKCAVHPDGKREKEKTKKRSCARKMVRLFVLEYAERTPRTIRLRSERGKEIGGNDYRADDEEAVIFL